jgi:hypothetical protein
MEPFLYVIEGVEEYKVEQILDERKGEFLVK